ncbi:hypothetical protein FGIG_04029 [Fasciola gigantica]|uniref:SUZ domain-containing protein n=1 Tax=Fasciola gigantica TaxID=46835 RepID=A0A504YUB4_FASGI|nr:hypothetical protein FGIG_04029 [Fasciola gigantica]
MEKPSIRILQRPCPIQSNQSLESSRPPIAVKTLEQREADYAAARRRIMGSESPEPESESQPARGANKHTIGGNGANECAAQRHSSSVTTPATPLMSIQAIPVATTGVLSDFRTPNTNPSGTTVQSARSVRPGLAVVNVAQKLQQQQSQTTINGARPMIPSHQQPQRILTASSNSPTIVSHTSRTSQHLPLFPSQIGNTSVGLLPTPPGFNYSAQNASLNTGGLHHPQSAALALMHHFTMLQQQYQQALNGFQNQLISPIVSNVSQNSLSHMAFSSAVSSQSGVNPKYTHPSNFH